MKIYLASTAENEEREVGDVIQENDKLRPIRDMNLATLMEDVDSESGSQNGLQGIDIDDPVHEKEGTMVTLERQGTPGEVHSSGCSYHIQTISITVSVKSISFWSFICVS